MFDLIPDFYNSLIKWFIFLINSSFKGAFILLITIVLVMKGSYSHKLKHFLLFFSLFSLIIVPLLFNISDGLGLPLNKTVEYFNKTTFGLSPGAEVSNSTGESISNINYPSKIFDFNFFSYLKVGFVLWLSVVILLALRFAYGVYYVYKIKRDSFENHNLHIQNELIYLKSRIGLAKPVKLFFNDNTRVPFAFGVWKPFIILPGKAKDWPLERLDVVLLHELYHIKRFDNLTTTIAAFVKILYWFNPLIWFAVRLQKDEQERACDELVISSGIKPSIYAFHLLKVIEASIRSGRGKIYSAVYMGKVSSTERRIREILAGNELRYLRFNKKNLIAITLSICIIISFSFLNVLAGENFGLSGPCKIEVNDDKTVSIYEYGLNKIGISDIPSGWPLASGLGKLEDGYGYQINKRTGKLYFNRGITIVKGYKDGLVVATADGVVKKAGFSPEYGSRIVVIEHKNGFSTVYRHLPSSYVHEGDRVKKGEIIAHMIVVVDRLYYEIVHNGKPINPAPFVEL